VIVELQDERDFAGELGASRLQEAQRRRVGVTSGFAGPKNGSFIIKWRQFFLDSMIGSIGLSGSSGDKKGGLAMVAGSYICVA
jgi:hypothetical protein